ncbi:MAG: hypothetical protein IJ242_08685 [Clostridia bacterium]|nr:hypothetical protein [Clostridia bacterium]
MKSLHLTHIEPGKMAHLFLAGVFLLFPVLLVNGVTVAVMTRFGIMQNHTDTGIIFFPAMIVALLLKPLSAALFYDEYLSFVLRRQKKWMVLLVPILLYAFQIGLKTGFVSAVFLAVLQVLCFHQSFSMLAPVLVLAGYGFSQSIAGINGLINSYIPGPGGTALLIFGTLAECMCLVKIWQIPVGTSRIQLPTSIRFERGEKRLLIGTGIAVILAIVAAEVFR